MKTLHLHIGSPKTATTSIQFFCAHNEKALNAKGYTYPIFDYQYRNMVRSGKSHEIEIRRNAHFLFGKIKNDDGTVDREKTKSIRNQGYDMLLKSFQTYDNVILSDEGIWDFSAKESYFKMWPRLKRFVKKNGIQLHVIVYLRRQDGLATSWLNQQIKEGWNNYCTMPWEDYIQSPGGVVLDYYEHLEKIAAVIGKECIDVHVFEHERFKDFPVEADFLQAVGLKMDDSFAIPEIQSNPSLPLNYCEIRRVMNGLSDLTESERDYLMRSVRNAIPEKVSYRSDWFSPEERQAFLEKYEESNRKVALEYLHPEGTRERLFDPEISDSPKWSADNPHMMEDIIRTFTAMMIEQRRELEMKAYRPSGFRMRRKWVRAVKKIKGSDVS